MNKAKISINSEKLIQTFILFGILSIFCYLIITNQFGSYLHPRFMVPIFLSMIFIVILLIFQAGNMFRSRKNRTPRLKYTVFLLFLALFLVSPKLPIDSSMADIRGVSIDNTPHYANGISENVSNGSKRESDPFKNDKPISNTVITDANDFSTAPNSNGDDNAFRTNEVKNGNDNPAKKKELTIIADYTMFVPALDEVFGNPEKYEGDSIVIRGFKFTPGDFKEGRFLIARLAIVCCAADAQPIGISCEYENNARLDEKGWYELTGVIQTETVTLYEEEQLWPYIEVKKHVSVAPPEEKYLYLY